YPIKTKDKTNEQVEDHVEQSSEKTEETRPANEVEMPKLKLFLDNPPPYVPPIPVPPIPYPQQFQKHKLDK
ncbi:hypothetical protein TorRG33x02_256360, partial [Trema orientale]